MTSDVTGDVTGDVSTVQITSDGPTLLLSGDFDVRSTASVRNAIYDHLFCWDGDIVVDLHAVPSVDLTALKVLGAACRRASVEGQHIVVRGATGQVLRMLHLTHLIRVIEVEREPIAV
ncbi:STAS domain-containing protein [Nocardioides sambongensis]|uniref:STAS domain-containing protein n=1 Tax=Nocardioides sambongensis TaxID=2589074 RepID=UPI001E2B86BC|nr:STAS domain-containing protein [Nocardioides sambongensis]